MFLVKATLQAPPGLEKMGMKEETPGFPCEAYVTWDSMPALVDMPVFLGIDNPPKPVSMAEAERLAARCAEVHTMYDYNLRIVPA